MQKASKFCVSGCKGVECSIQGGSERLDIAGHPRSGPHAELKCRARAAFWHEIKFLRENEDQLRSLSMLSKLQRGECNDFWKEIKAHNPKKESLPLTIGGTSRESNIANLWKDHFNSVGSTDKRDRVTYALGTVPGHNDVINVRAAANCERTEK